MFNSSKNILSMPPRWLGYFKINTPTTLFVSDGRVVFSSYIKDDNVSDDDLVNVYKKGLNLLETGNFS